jgi:type I restriction enzyme S subunit
MSNMNEKELYKLAEIRVSNVDKKIYQDKALVKLCNYMDVYNNDYINSKLAYSIGSADANELLRFGLKKNDVIITKDSETPDDIAISSIVTEDIVNLVCGYHLAIIRPNSEEIDGMFLMFKLKDNEIVRYFSNAAKGSTRFGLSIGDIENVKLKYPSLTEQRRIAHILSTCDAVIEKTQSAIAKYKAIKQGMLHDLFTRGIDLQTGKLRPRYEEAPELYKESKLGWIPREWEEKEIDSIGEIITGSTPPTAKSEYYGDEILFVSPADIKDNFYIEETGKKLTRSGFDVCRKLPEKSICVVCIGSTIGKMAMLANEGCTNQQINAVVCFDSDLATYFFYAMMFFNEPQFRRETGLQAVPIVNKSQFSEFSVPVAEKKEAFQIAERLNSIDNKLQTEQTYLQKMQQLKKGLMEDLLSGRKRVMVDAKEITQNEN